jgi:tetrapyrrole methylase family protein/MazG family protein
MKSMHELVAIMAKLRSPEGCPWDREQNHTTLKPMLLEEVYELIEAIELGDDKLMQEELGDVLLHLTFHAQLAHERGAFSMEEVLRGICEKMISRHPHVFGDAPLKTSEQVLERWHELKKKEKPERSSALDGVPKSAPALLLAQELQKKAARTGFDWPDTVGALEKLREEIGEVAALDPADKTRLQEEIGDLLFSMVNFARKSGILAEEACRQSSLKFRRRFEAIEARLAEEGREAKGCTLAELDRLWDEIKAGEQAGG